MTYLTLNEGFKQWNKEESKLDHLF